MAYEESNDHMTDDVTWHWKVKSTQIRLKPNISKTAGEWSNNYLATIA